MVVTLTTDTNRRVAELREKGIRYVGAGVSGGEEGARFRPSICRVVILKHGLTLNLSSGNCS